ncbi:bactofilin family protein [Halalkalibacillus halophilus]|uniref:bactofilin family protein n=1 Tax=Halalkalibacillus halophilus TaxID=392827 RepID=UPI00040AB76F|nr:polymer-forming cytoskeletal protein [Halalkalibacillus halophilus]
MFSKQDKQVSNVDTVIGAGTTFEGDLTSEASIRVDGTFKGSLSSQGDLVIGQAGKLDAELTGRNITVAGEVAGNITATETLTIEATGSVHGDVTMQVLVIEEGGSFSGNSKMVQPADPKKKQKEEAS